MKRRTFFKTLALAGAAFSIKPAVAHVHKELDKITVSPKAKDVHGNLAYVTTIVGGRTVTLNHPFTSAIIGYKAIDLFGNEVALKIDNKTKGLIDVEVQNVSRFRRIFPTAYKVIFIAKGRYTPVSSSQQVTQEQVDKQVKFLEQCGITMGNGTPPVLIQKRVSDNNWFIAYDPKENKMTTVDRVRLRKTITQPDQPWNTRWVEITEAELATFLEELGTVSAV